MNTLVCMLVIIKGHLVSCTLHCMLAHGLVNSHGSKVVNLSWFSQETSTLATCYVKLLSICKLIRKLVS